MTRALAHRGPDAEGFFEDTETGTALGHRRLSIVDLSGGAQPMSTADGELTIVFNGEIYNHAELRTQLRQAGHGFVTDHSDTEVLLHGYREWGEGLLDRLNGMWAFVIFERSKKRLFAARDRFGKKPFYYFHENGTFAFASELKALARHPSAPRSISSLALKKYFAYGYIPSPHSICDRIFKLPPGHFLKFETGGGKPEIRRHWRLELEPGEDRTESEWAEELRGQFDAAVQRRLIADVPVGVFLSGGIDSTAVATFAARHTDPGQLRTFSVGFTDPSFDELSFAKEAARTIGCRNDAEILDLSKARELLPGMFASLDEPLADSSLLPTWLLSRFTRRHVTVALGGDGGDELFAGYDPFLALRKAEQYARLVPRPMHAALRLMAGCLPVSHRNLSLDFKIKRTLLGLSHPPELWNPVWMGPLDPGLLSVYFGEPCPPEEIYSEAIAAWDSCAQKNTVDRTIQFFANLYLSEGVLTKVDRASMLHGLETRSPFLDREFVDLARRIPSQWKLRGNTTKYILKKAMEPCMPSSILHRRKKGFGTPVGPWLREGSISPDPDKSRNPGFVRQMVNAHRSGKADHRLFLWAEWVFQQWSQSMAEL